MPSNQSQSSTDNQWAPKSMSMSDLTAALSRLPTMAAMDLSPGSLRAPGAGWVTSAPKMMKWSMLPSTGRNLAGLVGSPRILELIPIGNKGGRDCQVHPSDFLWEAQAQGCRVIGRPRLTFHNRCIPRYKKKVMTETGSTFFFLTCTHHQAWC